MTRVVLAAGDDDVGAASRGGEGHLTAQPAAAAGDQHHPVGEIEQFVGVAHGPMVARCNCYSSGTRFRCAANPGRARTPTCPRRASSRPSGCPDALARFPITRLVEQPAAAIDADRAAGRRCAGADRRDRRPARRVRPRHGALHPDRADRRRVPRGAGPTGAGAPAQQRRRGRRSWPGSTRGSATW